ncbi:MAG: thioredoxin family protein [Magnetococcales bacterium]|nr:thioredoxin family protein [Magnetococcales bacterium]
MVIATDACPYCRAFLAEVAPVYPKTRIGRSLPLQVVDPFHPPEDLREVTRRFTTVPTFIVVSPEGKEIDRFTGYRGEESFWGNLERLVEAAGFDRH